MTPNTIKKLRVVLIKPSKYDDDGYVIRFWKGVLPSNTLSVLLGLTESVKARRVLGDVEVEIFNFDETAQKVPLKKILRWARLPETKLLVGLVGVQTNQYPRAVDIARPLRAAGVDVIMGGFHTSGTINMLGEQEPDIQALVREGITIVSGEVEEEWGAILADALHGRLKPIYSFAQDLQNLVNLGQADPPVIDTRTMAHFADPCFGTMDTSRGCPFSCSFCTIINVQGRKMRERSPESIVDFIRKNYHEKNIRFYFFTDDNFARKKYWRETFEALIRLREEEGIKISFVMQVDLARKPKDFVRLAAAAGCAHVFIGMESVNPENLEAEGKGQNHVDEYAGIIQEWHDVDIAVQTGYIIGLPYDTQEKTRHDVEFLMEHIKPDWASFFMLTPLPGSHDHREMKKRGAWMDPDFNKRDSFHATIKHPNMSAEEWFQAYKDAWKTFYSKENITAVLSRWNHNPTMYWNMIWVLLWYKNAALLENEHPMIAGFFRLKDRDTRRPGFAVDSWPVHARKRAREIGRLLIAWAKLLKEFEEIWLQSRKRSETEERWLGEIEKIQGEIWQTLRIREWQERYQRARASLPAQAKALLDPFEELTSKIMSSHKDLKAFLMQWENLQGKLHHLRQSLAHEGEMVKHYVEDLSNIVKSAKPGQKLEEWHEAYRRLPNRLPAKPRFVPARFDTLTNRVVYSREELHRFWSMTVAQLRSFRLWQIPPHRLLVALVRDFLITIKFASSFRTHQSRIN